MKADDTHPCMVWSLWQRWWVLLVWRCTLRWSPSGEHGRQSPAACWPASRRDGWPDGLSGTPGPGSAPPRRAGPEPPGISPASPNGSLGLLLRTVCDETPHTMDAIYTIDTNLIRGGGENRGKEGRWGEGIEGERGWEETTQDVRIVYTWECVTSVNRANRWACSLHKPKQTQQSLLSQGYTHNMQQRMVY